MIGSAIGGEEFIAHPQSRLGGWEAIEDPTNEGFVLDMLCKNPNTRIHHLPVGKELSYFSPQRACENIKELVVRRVSRGVILRM
jgi:hypothetical protein